MILDDLTLHNFGVYGGRQSIALSPREPGRPVILFGGLNGGGKTTLVDALQLCLYGQAARCSNRNGLAYEDYLRRSVHRGADAPEAAIQLAFRHRTDGVEQRFELHRSWTVANSGTRERFHVLRDGRLDRLATDNWAEQVEDFIPARIAHLFLFDGEKVEGYADLDGASGLIATAIQNLLGLDIVERLVADLGVLERRRRADLKGPETRAALDDAEAGLAELERERQRLAVERASAANALDRARHDLVSVEDRYRRDGGEAFERRGALEAAAAAAERGLATARRDVGELAAGVAPLLMVEGLLADLAARDAAEARARHGRDAVAMLEEEHGHIVGLPEVAALPDAVRESLRRSLRARVDARRSASDHPLLLDLGPETRDALKVVLGSELPMARERVLAEVDAEASLRRTLAEAGDGLAAVPSHDAVASVHAARTVAREAVSTLEAEQAGRTAAIAQLDGELSKRREALARLAEADARERFAQDDVRRVLTHSQKVRGTLGRFREAVVVRHVERIERLVLESFRRLVRKRELVSELRIDPQTFRLELRGGDGAPVTTDRLSAGERQLLAVAILWGLARASGRPLPTVIDTPLGRLDSEHRSHLVRRYFPNASHQVLLLSTDEEIAGRYYDDLRPSVDRAYRLRFDEAEGRTVVEDGYLEERGHAH